DDVIDIILNRKDPNGNNYFSRTIGKMKIIARIHPPKSYEIYYNQALPITGDALPYQKSSLNIIINGKKLPYYYGITIGEFGPINQSSLKWSIDDGVKLRSEERGVGKVKTKIVCTDNAMNKLRGGELI